MKSSLMLEFEKSFKGYDKHSNALTTVAEVSSVYNSSINTILKNKQNEGHTYWCESTEFAWKWFKKGYMAYK